MTEATVLSLASKVFVVTLKLAGPVLGTTLVVGVLVSLLQAVTQVQEMTVTFVPKMIALALVLLVLGSWMMHSMVDFSRELWANLPLFAR
jgi:flagellar biosynthetic protein FliQ